jgi:type IV secretion system protein VirB5
VDRHPHRGDQPPATADALRKNPLGIYVTAINWSKELGQ